MIHIDRDNNDRYIVDGEVGALVRRLGREGWCSDGDGALSSGGMGREGGGSLCSLLPRLNLSFAPRLLKLKPSLPSHLLIASFTDEMASPSTCPVPLSVSEWAQWMGD